MENGKLKDAAKLVVRLQSDYDGANHTTTSADFMQKHGKDWQARRNEILGPIESKRTEAIWALGRLL